MPLLAAVVLITGMVFGFKLRDSLRYKRDITTIIERNDRLEQVIDLIKQRYVDTVNPNLLYEDAVNGILSHLDPHTEYIAADRLQRINEDMMGSFFGIGISFTILNDTIQVTSVVDDGPARVAGLEIGDQIIKVGDSIVAGTNITSERIMGLLKGKQYSKVFVTLMDPVDGRQRTVTIKRDAIPNYSIDASIMLDSITGLVKITRFSATTYDEFVKAVTNLKKQGMKQLLIDVRQNPGGYLDAVKNIIDELLPGEKLIVYTKGLNSSKTEYLSGSEGVFENGKVAVLVDENSASASEILAGSVQDWDRGVIIGRRTFGKGLVQDQYSLEDGSALRLTIARYYIPSGRCIQRSFEDGREAYEEEMLARYHNGELIGYDTIAPADTTKYYTANKRVVYGGGGITPDVYVPYDTARMSTALLNLVFSDGFKSVIWDYYLYNRAKLKQYKNVSEYDAGFDANILVEQYISLQDKPTRRVIDIMLKNKVSKAYFTLQMKAQLARLLYGNNGYFSITMPDDVVVKKAMNVLSSDAYSNIISR